MKVTDKIRYHFNFSKNEIKIIFFLTITLIIGTAIKVFKSNFSDSSLPYDYSKSDSIFFSTSNVELPKANANNNNLSVQSSKFILKEKSLNINNATKSDLVKLPGIGEVLAENIIKYREENGKFDDINQLLKVKGIGKKKLEKIKPYIFIE